MNIASPPAETASPFAGMQDDLVAANINPKTGLSTDYLNHFNEMVMLVELYPSAPDLKDEILEWRLLSYREHFETSGFRAKALALLAYDLASPALKKNLDVLVAELHTVLFLAQNAISAETFHGEADPTLRESSEAVENLIARTSALINGLAEPEEASADDAQAAVDALFGG